MPRSLPFVERQFDRHGLVLAPPDVDLELRAGSAELRRHVTQANSFLQARREIAAGDDADFPPIRKDFHFVAGHALLEQLERHQLPRRALLLLLLQSLAADELALREVHRE